MSPYNHKSLITYIREQTWPRLFYPLIPLVISAILLLVLPDVNHQPENLSSLSDSVQQYKTGTHYVTVSVDTLYYSGLNYEDRAGINARVYYALEDNTCYYFILDNTVTLGGQAELKDLTIYALLDSDVGMYEEISSHMSEILEFSENNLKEVSSGILFNQYEYSNGFLMFCYVGLHIIAGICLLLLLYIGLALIFPVLSFSVLPLHRYGKISGLWTKACREFDTALPIGRRNIYLTDTFFIVLLRSGIIILPLAHITWIYQTHQVRHKRGNARMIHTLCLVTDKARIVHIPQLSEPVIATLINAIASRFPNIHIGNGKINA